MVGLTRDCELFIPNGDTEICEGDKLIFMGTSHSLDILAGTFFHEKEYAGNTEHKTTSIR